MKVADTTLPRERVHPGWYGCFHISLHLLRSSNLVTLERIIELAAFNRDPHAQENEH